MANFLSRLIPKTKEQKHREWLIEEYKKGHVLHIDGKTVNKKPSRE